MSDEYSPLPWENYMDSYIVDGSGSLIFKAEEYSENKKQNIKLLVEAVNNHADTNEYNEYLKQRNSELWNDRMKLAEALSDALNLLENNREPSFIRRDGVAFELKKLHEILESCLPACNVVKQPEHKPEHKPAPKDTEFDAITQLKDAVEEIEKDYQENIALRALVIQMVPFVQDAIEENMHTLKEYKGYEHLYTAVCAKDAITSGKEILSEVDKLLK